MSRGCVDTQSERPATLYHCAAPTQQSYDEQHNGGNQQQMDERTDRVRPNDTSSQAIGRTTAMVYNMANSPFLISRLHVDGGVSDAAPSACSYRWRVPCVEHSRTDRVAGPAAQRRATNATR